MTPPPFEVVQWLKRTYPRPTVDPEWLEGCYAWIIHELHLRPERDMATILKNVNEQLLQSDFTDSMLAGTGFPQDVFSPQDTVLEGPVLVEVTEMMEIGHSAYSLLHIYESRAEWRKQAELRAARGERDPGEKPMPKYPRSMLKFQLSDGASLLPAIEFKRLPDIELGETPLGCKMIIKNVPIRRGIAFLQPDRVRLIGHQTPGRNELRDALFLRALKMKLGMPVEDELVPAPAPVEAPMSAAAAAPARAPAPAVAPQATPPHIPSPTLRSPLRDITPPPDAEACPSASPCNIGGEHDDDAGQPRRRKRPSRAGRSRSRDPPQRDVVLERSRYFSKPASDGRPSGTTAVSNGMASADLEEDAGRVRVDLGDANAMHDLKRAIGLSPHRLSPVDLPDDDEDEDFTRSTGSSSKGKGKQKVTFGEPGSEDYPFDFEMDDSFLEQVSRVEHEAYLRETSSQMNGKSQNQPPAPTGTQVKSEPRSQSASGTLFGATATATTLVGTQRGAIGGVGRDMPMEVIDISDEEVEIDKENVPAPTRHVRRRVAPVENVIELSD